MLDARRPGVAYDLLQRGYAANPRNWRFPFYLGFFAYAYASGSQKDVVAAQWYAKAARLPGAPAFVPRLAAELAAKGNATQTSIDLGPRSTARATNTPSRRPSRPSTGSCRKTRPPARRPSPASRASSPQALFSQFVADLFQGYH